MSKTLSLSNGLKRILSAVLVATLVFPFASSPADAHHGDATIQMYWEEVREEYPVLPPVKVGDDFVPSGIEIADYTGLTEDGYARVSIRQGWTPTDDIVWHEAGHAYADVAGRKGFTEDIFALFWKVRGFPGTWQEAFERAKDAQKDPSLSSFQKWRLLPNEMWAEAFKAANLGGAERTENYGVPLNHQVMTAFFKSLMVEPVLSYVSGPFPVQTDGLGNADLEVPIYGLWPYEPTLVLVQRVGTTGAESRVPGLIGQSFDGIKATVRVRGDSIRGGTIWLQIAALQGLSISSPFPVWTDENGNADLYGLPLAGTVRGRPTTVLVQRIGTTGDESVVPGLMGQSTDGVTATIRVRGDFVKGGIVWLQRAALQRYGSAPFWVFTNSNGDSDWPYIHISRMPGSPTLVLALRVGTTGIEPAVPGLMAQWSPGWTTIRVRGDYVQSGTIWLQYFAIQSNYGYQRRLPAAPKVPNFDQIAITE